MLQEIKKSFDEEEFCSGWKDEKYRLLLFLIQHSPAHLSADFRKNFKTHVSIMKEIRNRSNFV